MTSKQDIDNTQTPCSFSILLTELPWFICIQILCKSTANATVKKLTIIHTLQQYGILTIKFLPYI